ncbi:MAG: TauD/TfdA family dioxygenase [Prochloraceae cyanobacterium]|nr:TauD/TfdA family dioxygenase [Prochloraceae cyanobacterium]
MNLTAQIEVKPLAKEFGKIIINPKDVGILDLDKQLIIDLFKAYGVLLFRGFKAGCDQFLEFSNSLSTDFMDYTGGYLKRQVINDNPTLLSVNDFNSAIGLHGEMYYQKQHPAMLWFYCDRPPVKDGQTIVCDGIQFYNELSDTLKDLFQQKKIKYPSKLSKEEWQRRYKTEDIETAIKMCVDNGLQVKMNQDESMSRFYSCPAVYPSRSQEDLVFINLIIAAKKANPNAVRFEDDSEINEEIVSELNEIASRITVEIDWQKGDILMVDNYRVMHGRRAFSDTQRNIYIRMCASAFQAK